MSNTIAYRKLVAAATALLAVVLLATVATAQTTGPDLTWDDEEDIVYVANQPDDTPEAPEPPPSPSDTAPRATTQPDADDDTPPEPEPDETPTPPPPRLRSPVLRLASVPNMFGDMFGPGGQLEADYNFVRIADFPAAGGAVRTKIAENNRALPTDRVYFMYNHYQNVLQATPDALNPAATRDFSVDRYVVGVEKTFGGGMWSVDIRMPFVGEFNAVQPGVDVHGGQVGNLSIMLKRMLYYDDATVVAVGMGIDTPTGSNAFAQVDTTQVEMHNEAVHLSPWIGFMRQPGPDWFVQGFLQLDVATGGNRVDYADAFASQFGSFGRLDDQNLLYLDLAIGRWIARNPHAPLVTGLAPVLEFHYTSTLNDADMVSGFVNTTAIQIGNLDNRIDAVHMTLGIHTELRRHTTLRVGGVIPLQDDSNRIFDGEVQVSLNRRY